MALDGVTMARSSVFGTEGNGSSFQIGRPITPKGEGINEVAFIV